MKLWSALFKEHSYIKYPQELLIFMLHCASKLKTCQTKKKSNQMRAKELFVSDSQELKHKIQNLQKISKFLQRIIDIVGDCSTCTINCQMQNINIFFGNGRTDLYLSENAKKTERWCMS